MTIFSKNIMMIMLSAQLG